MFIESLTLQNFRSFKSEKFAFEASRTVINGKNGRGKSNLLESIYFLAIAKSNRGSPEREIIQTGEEHFQIQSSVRKEARKVDIRIYYDQQSGKRIFLDESPLPRLSELLGTFNAVLFSPEDVDLVLRYPHERRRMLDMLASQASVSYLSDLQTYQRALTQRNRLLKNGLSPAQAGEHLHPWDLQLAEAGARIVRFRQDAVQVIGPSACGYYASVTHGEELRVRYQSFSPATGVSAIQSFLLEELEKGRDREIRLGYTITGPHKDQLLFEIGGRDIQRHASQGQMKSVLLAWKLAEAAFLESIAREMPVLLLDDIFSELDVSRSLRLLDLLKGFNQIILTTARDPDLPMEDYHRIAI